ncbi:hypothetical protein JL720_4420 [Aureococcus anophagefferens]|nr:hypothetical protein JL720_4420 [Aureococcus anophagefferens]
MPSAACAFPQRLATHLDAAYGPGAVKVAVRAMSGSGSGTASKNGHIIDGAATTDLLILDYAINDAIVATAKTYDVDDVAGLPEAKAVRASTEKLLRVFTKAAHVAVLCTFYVPLSPASWTHWLASGARGHAARDGSPTFTFVACATEDELRRANRLHYAYQDIVAPVARRYGASLVSYRDAFWPDVASPPHVAYWYNTRAYHETCGRYGGPFRQDPHPTYEDHQLIADRAGPRLAAARRAPHRPSTSTTAPVTSPTRLGRGESTYETVDVPAPAARCGAGAARDVELRVLPRDASRKLKFKLVGLAPAPGS